MIAAGTGRASPRLVEVLLLALGVGLVGLGWHGERYARHLAAGDVPGLALAAVCRRDVSLGEARARELGVRFHATVEALARDPAVDVLAVVSPGGAHVAPVRAGIAAKKAVLVEKPLAHSARDAWSLAREARAHGARVMVAHTLRWEPLFETAAASARPDLGRLEAVRVDFGRDDLLQRASADFRDQSHHRALYAIGVHYLDWAGLLFPGGFAEASAAGEDDLACEVSLRARDGGRFELAVRLAAERTRDDFAIRGERGALAGDRLAHTLARTDAARPRPVALPGKSPTLPRVLSAFRDFVRGERDNPVTLEEGARAVSLVEACVRSLERKAPVSLEEEPTP